MEVSNGLEDLNHHEEATKDQEDFEIIEGPNDVKSIAPSESTDTGFGSDCSVSTPGPESESKQIISEIVSDLVENSQSSSSGEKTAGESVVSDGTTQDEVSEKDNLPDTDASLAPEETIVEKSSNNDVPVSENVCEKEVTECVNNVEEKDSVKDADVVENTSSIVSSPLSMEMGDSVNTSAGLEDSKEKVDKDTAIDILGNGFLKKRVIVSGKGEGTRPVSGDTVTIRTSGVLETGATVNPEDLTFIVNDGDVIMAFDLCVSLMEAEETCELFTDARYAYGSLGRKPDIPSDSSITYNIQLLDIQPAQDITSVSAEKRLQMGEAKRERGNYLYGRQDYTGAINSYTKATKILDNTDLNAGLDEATQDLLSQTYVKCYNNMAACQLKLDALDAAIRSCEKVLAVQQDNVKALFRIGKAYSIKNEVDTALTYLRRGIKLDPESKMLHQEVLALARKKSQQSQSEKEMYRKMLGVEGETAWEAKRRKDKKSGGVMKWVLMAGSVAAVLAGLGLTWYRTT